MPILYILKVNDDFKKTNILQVFNSISTFFFPRWLSVNLDTLANILIFSTGLFQILTPGSTAGDTGLVISYALQVSAAWLYAGAGFEWFTMPNDNAVRLGKPVGGSCV